MKKRCLNRKPPTRPINCDYELGAGTHDCLEKLYCIEVDCAYRSDRPKDLLKCPDCGNILSVSGNCFYSCDLPENLKN